MQRSVRWLAVAIGMLAVGIVAASIILVLGSQPPHATAAPMPSVEALCNEASPAGHFHYRVEQDSMRPTLGPGDVLLIDTDAWRLHRGEIVVFDIGSDMAAGVVPFIKRAIALGGDTVEIRDGDVYVNGAALDEPYVLGRSVPGESRSWSVTPGTLFVIGDNRNNSTDSRSEAVGLVPVESVLGRAVYRCSPVTRRGALP